MIDGPSDHGMCGDRYGMSSACSTWRRHVACSDVLHYMCLLKVMFLSGDCKHYSASYAYHTCLPSNLVMRLPRVYTIPHNILSPGIRTC